MVATTLLEVRSSYAYGLQRVFQITHHRFEGVRRGGRTDDALELLRVDISPMRIKCAVLAEKAAQDGAEIYFGEKDIPHGEYRRVTVFLDCGIGLI